MIKAYRSFFPKSQSGMLVIDRCASRRRCERLEHESGDGVLSPGGHGGRAQPASGQDRQQQPGAGVRIGIGADAALSLREPDPVGQVRRDCALPTAANSTAFGPKFWKTTDSVTSSPRPGFGQGIRSSTSGAAAGT
jgi:hypothetical protein